MTNATTIIRCAKCGERHGTEVWTESAFSIAHGIYSMWCKPCVYLTQLEHARVVAAQIPALEALLLQALAVDGGAPVASDGGSPK